MKRLTLAALLTVAVLPLSAVPAQASSLSPLQACHQSATTPASVRALIICWTQHRYVPGGTQKALAIAWRESNYQPGADNPHSSACGVYQDLDSTWHHLVGNYLWGHRLDPVYCKSGRANVFLNLRYAHWHGWGPWGG